MIKTPSELFIKRNCPLSAMPLCPEIQVFYADNPFQLWEEWENETGQQTPVPHWGIVWPGAAVLARYTLDHSDIVRGKKVLEIGCGGGTVSIAAKKAGAAKVQANDIDPAALVLTAWNASVNHADIETDPTDYLSADKKFNCNLIFLADFFYQKIPSQLMTLKLRSFVQTGGRVIIADGGRPFTPVEGAGLLYEKTVPANEDLEGVSKRHVRILELI